MDYLTMTIGKQKNIALIAHDQKKHDAALDCRPIRTYCPALSVRDGNHGADDYGVHGASG